MCLTAEICMSVRHAYEWNIWRKTSGRTVELDEAAVHWEAGFPPMMFPDYISGRDSRTKTYSASESEDNPAWLFFYLFAVVVVKLISSKACKYSIPSIFGPPLHAFYLRSCRHCYNARVGSAIPTHSLPTPDLLPHTTTTPKNLP